MDTCQKPTPAGPCVCAAFHDGWCGCESDPKKVCRLCGLPLDHSKQKHPFTPMLETR